MFNFLKKLFSTSPSFVGVVKDPRSAAQKSLDFQHDEVAAAFGVAAWRVNDPSTWSKLSIRNQDGSSSCVSQGIAKAYEMKFGEPYSALPIYTNRKNKPALGMWLQDGGDIAKKIGTVPERLLGSQNMNETQMNVPVSMSQFSPSDIKKAKAYVFINPKDIDALAAVLDAGFAVILTFESNYGEWKEIPKYSGLPTQWGHCVCDPKDRTLWTDKDYTNMKAIVIDESWGVGINADHILPVDGKRLITEDFLKARATGAMYLIFDDAVITQKPKYTFSKNLMFGMKADADVKALQAILAYEGYFPTEAEYHTGNFGNMTLNAVKKLQLMYASDILYPAGLSSPTGYVGPYTITWLNNNFSS